jgi:polysaccharide export outer membrane protein
MTSVAVSGVAGVSAERTFQNVYAVASNGTITLPVLGDIQVAGLTTEELKQKLIKNLNDYLKDPIVSVRITNFKVTVIGEVSRPVVIPVDGEKINVLQALGLAGDMTVYGTRATVKVMRNINDSMQVAHLNFNSANQLLQSPFFQLHQNDVVYVTPVSNKGTRTENVAIWLPVILSILTTITLVIWRLKA